jgi:hypothetical protein
VKDGLEAELRARGGRDTLMCLGAAVAFGIFAGVAALMACLSGCPHGMGQDTETCVNACAPQKEKTPRFALFNDVATCSKKMPPFCGKCDWP